MLTAPADYAINNGLTPFISMQNQYSLVYREEEREMFPTLKVSTCTPLLSTVLMRAPRMQLFGVGSIPWSPLARGLLTRPLTEKSKRGDTDWFLPQYKGSGTPDIVGRCAGLRACVQRGEADIDVASRRSRRRRA